MTQSIWYVGGKSAGHIMPLITLARASQAPSVFITSHRLLDKQLIAQASDTLGHCALYIPDFERKKWWRYPWVLIATAWAMARIFILAVRTQPKKVISTGGIYAVPVFAVARLLRIPCELFELNAVPGDAVRVLARFSTTIFYCYKAAIRHLPEKKAQYKPYPIRSFDAVTAYEARQKLGLDPEKKTICFLGGSQGSRFINDLARELVLQFSPEDIQVIHQAGASDYSALAAWYAEKKYRAYVIDFYAEIEIFYCAADFVVCRAGAGTLWELEYMNVPACIIPLQTAATDHQIHNARALCQQKPDQFTLVMQEAATASALEALISEAQESQ